MPTLGRHFLSLPMRARIDWNWELHAPSDELLLLFINLLINLFIYLFI